MIAIRHGLREKAAEYWGNSIACDAELLDSVIVAAKGRLSSQQIAETILGKDPERIVAVAENYFGKDADHDANQELIGFARTILQKNRFEYDTGKRDFLKAKLYFLSGETTRGINLLEKTINDEGYSRHQWRVVLAQMYLDVGRPEDSLTQIEKCLNSVPGNESYIKFREEILTELERPR